MPSVRTPSDEPRQTSPCEEISAGLRPSLPPMNLCSAEGEQKAGVIRESLYQRSSKIVH